MYGREWKVSCHTEWDPLEEIIVGHVDGTVVTQWEPGFEAMIPHEHHDSVRDYHLRNAGQPFTEAQAEPARREIEEFVRVLVGEGVIVRRPELVDNTVPYSTPDFYSPGGFGQYNPRDVLTVIGDELIESPMSWRSRYFEFRAYRSLVKEYFRHGARWTQAPKPQMSDELFRSSYRRGKDFEWVTTEFEPVWDAADLVRCGRDLFFQRSHTTNEFGIEWLRRHLGPAYRVHQIEFDDDRAVHIDATFMPLAPGKLLVNPDRPARPLPEIFARSGWDVRECPRTTYPRDLPSFRGFEWLVMNTLSLDERRIVVEQQEEPFIRFLKDWGFTPIPVAYRNCYKHGGSFHCSTLDVRRRGELASYFT